MPKGRRSQFDSDDLIQRYLAGESLNSLTKLYRTDRSTIREVLDVHGIKPRGQAEATRLATAANVDSAALVARYAVGESVHALAKAFGVDPYAVRRVLSEAEVTARVHAESMRLTRTVHLDEPEVVRRYMEGESAKTLALAYGHSERIIYRVLSDHGVTARTITEANNLVLNRLTLAQRRERGTRHPPVWEGRSYPSYPVTHPDRMRKRSRTRELTRQYQKPDELMVLGALPGGWITGQQSAVDRYNIDLTRRSVAMEVHSPALHPFRSEHNVSRAIDLAELGWHVVYFWPNGGCIRRITDRGIAELVAHAERLDRDPSPERQYLVIRGGGEVVAAGRFDLEKRSLVATPVDAPEVPDRSDARIAG